MFRNEIGVYFKPLYDHGDYPREIRTYDVADQGNTLHKYRERRAMYFGTYIHRQFYPEDTGYDIGHVEDWVRESNLNDDLNDEGIIFLGEDDLMLDDDVDIAVVHKKDYSTPRLYTADDLPFIHSTFDWVDGEVVCMDLNFLHGYKGWVRGRL